MKHGETIDIETAHTLFKYVCQQFLPDARMVIWPESKMNDALQAWKDNGPPHLPLCRRKLLNFVCLQDEVALLLSAPRPDYRNAEEYGTHIFCCFVPYDFKLGVNKFQITAHFVILGKGEGRTAEIPHNKQLIEAGEIDLYKSMRDFQKADEYDLRMFQLAHVCEHYAFSPCATIKQRPRLIKAMIRTKSEDPLTQREWPAIEIVSLRRLLIEKRGDHSHTGRKLNMRVSVIEHLRRQPTKAGVKLITIAEHLRGPKDAPLKPKTEKVYKVTR